MTMVNPEYTVVNPARRGGFQTRPYKRMTNRDDGFGQTMKALKNKGGNTMKSQKMKKVSKWMALLAIVGMSIGKVHAANPATLNLKVTVAPSLSIAVGTATYSFGTLGTNVTALSTGAIPVTNDS